MKVEIKEASPLDLEFLVDFQIKMARETEEVTLNHETVTAGVKAVFQDSNKGSYYVAQLNGQIVGSLLLTYEWSDWRNGCILWIQSVYVLPEFRSGGVFKSLFLHVQSLVQKHPGYVGIRLYVDKGNQLAQRVYRSLGMDGDHYQVFEWIA